MKKVLYSILPTIFLMMAAVGVQAQCHAGFIWEQIPGTLQIHFQNTSTSENDIISNIWDFGDNHEGDGINPTHSYPEPGTYLVCLIIHDSEGCASDVCHEVTVQPLQSECDASFTWEQIPGTFQIHFNSTSTSQYDIVSYHWDFGDSHEGDGHDPYHTYSAPGSYLVCLIIEDNEGCVSDVCMEVTVEGILSECDANFTWEQFSGSLEVDFTNTSESDHDIISFVWHFGDGHNGDGPNPSHTYNAPGTYVVCLIITNEAGCISDVCHEVQVQAPEGDCHAAFTWEIIPGTFGVYFFSQSTSQNDIISYHWTFGDGHDSNDHNPSHEYNEPGTYLVCLRIEDTEGCVGEICHEVHVGEVEGCHASFTWEQIPGTQQIHFNSTSTSQNDIVSVWHFGDGHEGDGNDPYHTYELPGTYVVCLIITDSEGCVSDVCHEVHVGEPEGDCHAAFTWEIIPGTFGVYFFSQSSSQNDIISYHWTFGDGHDSNDHNPSHEYNEPGTYLVCLRIEDSEGCVSEICHEVHVGELEGCHASFTWEQITGTQQIHFNSTSTSQNDIVSYVWHFGDGHEGDGNDPYHTYEEPGTYLVCLSITDSEGCVSDVCHEVHVGEPEEEECNASFNFETNEEGVIFFNNNSTGTTEHATWLWVFDDGHTSDAENPHHTYDEPGIYTVCLFISDTTNECVDSFCLTIAYEMGWEESHYDEMPPSAQSSIYASSSLNKEITILKYTNPVSEDVQIDYYLNADADVRFELYDLTGNRLMTDYTDMQVKGLHLKMIDISSFHPGLYILSMTSGIERTTMRLTISR